jgi:hypothetical protein
MSKPKTYQPTPEQIVRWKRIEELEPTASAGILSEEEQRRNVKELLEPNYLENRLLEVRAYKEKLLKKLASAEEYEQILVEEIQKKNCS